MFLSFNKKIKRFNRKDPRTIFSLEEEEVPFLRTNLNDGLN